MHQNANSFSQMSALAVIGSTLNRPELNPLSHSTGAKSSSDPNAGSQVPIDPAASRDRITTADRAGAGILTVLIIALFISTAIILVK